jgi:hypothetical protein
MRNLNRAFLKVFLLAAPLAASIGACSDSSEEEKKTVDLSAQCTINSDCKDPLVCAFARCHVECAEARDCPTGQRCVFGDHEEAKKDGVCQLEDEVKCSRDGDCDTDQFCAQDGECRNGCRDNDDCVVGYKCTPSNACAADDELEPDGDIPVAPPPGGGEGGAGGAPSAVEGGAGGEGPSPSTGGATSAGGAGGEPGTEPSDGGAPSGDDCSLPDVDNNDRDSATPYELGTEVEACLQSKEDLDFYEFTTPAEPAQGGWLVARATDVGTDGNYYLDVYSGTDNARIQRFYGAMGSNGAVWIPAAPSQVFRALIEPYSVIPPEYTFSAVFTGVDDSYEPNDSRDDAVPIEVGDEVEGYLFQGYKSSTRPENDQDWFEVNLAAGSVTATLNQPEGSSSYIYLVDSAGGAVKNAYGAGGEDVTLTQTGLAIGTYYFNVQHYNSAMVAGQGTTPPDLEAMPYVFQVTQD